MIKVCEMAHQEAAEKQVKHEEDNDMHNAKECFDPTQACKIEIADVTFGKDSFEETSALVTLYPYYKKIMRA